MKFLVLIKPEIVAHRVLREAVIRELEQAVRIETMKTMRIDRGMAAELYEQHRGKFFYDRLVRHISSGEVIAMRVEGNARNSIGSSKLWPRAEPEEQPIRQKIGLSDVRNVAHASDEEVAERELKLFQMLD